MNVLFTLLVALSVLVAGYSGSPAHSGSLTGLEMTVQLDPASAVKVGGAARVEAQGVEYPGTVLEVIAGATPADPPSARLRTFAPNGEVEVRFDAEHRMKLVSDAGLEQAKKAVELAIGLVGAMTLFLGLMKVVEAGGGLDLIARTLRPLLVFLFPDVPAQHPAMGAMVMNLSANMLGLGNAATPFGIKAMQELDTLNREKGTATNAMVLFLALNTSGITILPTGVMAVRAVWGSQNPASILPTTILASAAGMVVAILIGKGLGRIWRGGSSEPCTPEPVAAREFVPLFGFVGAVAALCIWVSLDDRATFFILPGLIAGMLGFGVVRGVKVYETLVEGGREGFDSAKRIIPYVAAILVAVGMFRASGAMDVVVGALAVPAGWVHIPPEVLPLAFLRPLSGSGAFALFSEMTRTFGPDSYLGNLVGTMQGSTETTFYVLAVYFGSVGITRFRHAVPVGVLSDVAGFLASVVAVRWLIGGP